MRLGEGVAKDGRSRRLRSRQIVNLLLGEGREARLQMDGDRATSEAIISRYAIASEEDFARLGVETVGRGIRWECCQKPDWHLPTSLAIADQAIHCRFQSRKAIRPRTRCKRKLFAAC